MPNEITQEHDDRAYLKRNQPGNCWLCDINGSNLNCGVCGDKAQKDTKMPNEITQEQAVEIAKWLGFKYFKEEPDRSFSPAWLDREGKEILWNNFPMGNNQCLLDWLASPKGLAAMMRKCLAGPIWIGVEIYIPPDEELQGDAYAVTLVNIHQKQIIGNGETINAALQRAILEMFKGKK